MPDLTMKAIWDINLHWRMRFPLWWHRVRGHRMRYGGGHNYDDWWKLVVTCQTCHTEWAANYMF
jgi:hypothetical protein